jgi:hypothetical protein
LFSVFVLYSTILTFAEFLLKKIKSLCLTKHYAIKAWGVGVETYGFWTLTLVGSEW